MTQPTQHAASAASIRDQAAQWSDRLRHSGSDAALRREFQAWLAQDPAHARAFARIDGAHRMARAAKGSQATAAMLRQTRLRIEARRHRRRLGAAIAAGVAVLMLGGLVVSDITMHDVEALPDHLRHAFAGERLYRTDVGERRSVTLDDGTRLTLNTDSRAIVRLRPAERGVDLQRGQALFEVAHDPSRPFVVAAGNRTVTALGTAFDVHVSDDRLAVTLLEGKVAVGYRASLDGEAAQVPAAESTILTPGEQWVVATRAAARPEVHRADVERAVSWREGHLLFHGDRLDQVIAEVNRYRSRPLVLADERLGELRISGVVNTADTAVFVETMTTYYPLRIVEDGRRRVVLGPRG